MSRNLDPDSERWIGRILEPAEEVDGRWNSERLAGPRDDLHDDEDAPAGPMSSVTAGGARG